MEGLPFLQAVSVSKIFAGIHRSGIKTTSIDIQQGKITAIIGESGSGKSTLLRLLYGYLSPDSGQVLFKGERVWGPEEKLIPGHDAMKLVTQHTDDLNLFAKVWDNIATMLPHTDLKGKQEKTEKIINQLNLTNQAGKRVADLSGGEKQRVAIARALITGPEILLLDEPFNQVDTSFREGLQQDIRQIVKDTGLTVIMVSHDPQEVLSMADELIVLKDGKILESDSPRSLYKKPRHLYTARLLTNCNVFTKNDAHAFILKINSDHFIFYPEWAKIIQTWTHNEWLVKQVLFKGCFEDLLLEKDGIAVRVLNDQFGKYKEGDNVSLKLRRWLEY